MTIGPVQIFFEVLSQSPFRGHYCMPNSLSKIAMEGLLIFLAVTAQFSISYILNTLVESCFLPIPQVSVCVICLQQCANARLLTPIVLPSLRCHRLRPLR